MSCFAYKVIRNLESIDHLCINPILRIGLIHKRSIDLRMLKLSLHVFVILRNCEQSITVTVTPGWHDNRKLQNYM